MRRTLVLAATLALAALCVAAAPPAVQPPAVQPPAVQPPAVAVLCEGCIDQWQGRVDAKARVQHMALVNAGQQYEVKLAPQDANADLIVAADNNFPPEMVLCRSARGAKSVDSCRFGARADMPVHVFVVGKYHQTGYQLTVSRATE